MHFLNKIVPPFLKKVDRHLLLNHRLIWETKLHYILFFGTIGFIAMTVFGHIYPISLSSELPEPATIGLLTAIPSFILLCYWGYMQSRYSIERDFGRLFSGLGQWRFLIYLFSIGMFAVPSLQVGSIISNRIANLVDDKELDEDILTLNIGNPFFITSEVMYHNSYYTTEPSNGREGDIFQYLDCTMKRDSEYSCNDYDFHYFGGEDHNVPYFYNESVKTDYLKMNNYFRKTSNKKQHIDQIAAFMRTFGKYGGRLDGSINNAYSLFKQQELSSYEINAQKYFVKKQIEQIEQAKEPVANEAVAATLKVSLILAFMFSLLMYVLKSVGLKDFIISIVSITGVIIATIGLTTLWNELVNYSVLSEEGFFNCLSFGIVAFTIHHVTQTVNVYSKFKTICLVAFTLVAPFLLVWANVSLDIGGYDAFPNEDEILLNLIVTGVAIHFFFILPKLRKKFLRMQALPKQ